MAFILCAKTSTGLAEGLTRIAGGEDERTEALKVFNNFRADCGLNVIPDRRFIQGRFFHPRHESGRCVTFPLNVKNGSYPSEGEVNRSSEHSGAGAEVGEIDGMYSQVIVQITLPGDSRVAPTFNIPRFRRLV